MRRFIESKKAGSDAQVASVQSSPSATLAADAPAQVETDMRTAEDAPARSVDEQRGQKRAADETSVRVHQPTGPAAPTHAPKEQRVRQQPGDRCKP